MTPLKRSGLHRVICAQGCGATFYGTLGQIREGMPGCRCGASMVPEHPELAAEVLPSERWGEHRYLAEFEREFASVQHGQASHVQRGRTVRPAEGIAGERVAAAMAIDAKSRRLAGLRQFAAATAATAEVPF